MDLGRTIREATLLASRRLIARDVLLQEPGDALNRYKNSCPDFAFDGDSLYVSNNYIIGCHVPQS